MNETDLRLWVKGCAAHIIKKREIDRLFKGDIENQENNEFINSILAIRRRGEGKDISIKDLCFYDYEGLMSQLDSSEREINTAYQTLSKLSKHFELGELIFFDEAASTVKNAKDSLLKAWLDVRGAKEIVRFYHPTGTRALDLHKLAVRFAEVYAGDEAPRRVRAIAKSIMLAANLPEADDSSISNWMREVRTEMGNSNPV